MAQQQSVGSSRPPKRFISVGLTENENVENDSDEVEQLLRSFFSPSQKISERGRRFQGAGSVLGSGSWFLNTGIRGSKASKDPRLCLGR